MRNSFYYRDITGVTIMNLQDKVEERSSFMKIARPTGSTISDTTICWCWCVRADLPIPQDICASGSYL